MFSLFSTKWPHWLIDLVVSKMSLFRDIAGEQKKTFRWIGVDYGGFQWLRGMFLNIGTLSV